MIKMVYLQPILSAISTLTYCLAKFLLPIVAKLTSNEYNIKQTYSFADEIINQDTSFFMASFGVNSLLLIYR